jgi:hypothetical protein
MLDTEAKVDQFLVDLKTEIMAARMIEGESGPWVTVKVKDEGAGYINQDGRSGFYNGTKKKIISVNIFEEKHPLILCGHCYTKNKKVL